MDQVAAIMSNLQQALSNVSEACGEPVRDFPGVTCARHRSCSADFNLAFVHEERALEHPVIRDVQGFFREIGASWCLVVPPTLTHLFDRVVKSIRISQRRAVPQMIMKSGDVSVPFPLRTLRIGRVDTISELRIWARTMRAGFDMGRHDPFKEMLNARGLSTLRGTAYTGRVSGKAVATSVSYVTNGVGGIYGVSTIPRARGRGYGEAMTWAAIRNGVSRSCEIISLQASPMGFPVYYRMGFRRVFDIEEWTIPAKAPDVAR